jgi:dienelactone hydrolase
MRVHFESAGETLVGELHLPPATKDKSPALVVAGPWGSVKEQVPGRYADELAARGFLVLAFDFRGWGESPGEARSVEDPFAKSADLVAAVNYLAGRPDVDAIGGLGICAGSAYVATAATQTELIKSVALIAPALPSRETTIATMAAQPENEIFNPGSRAAWLEYDAQTAAAELRQPLFVMHSKAAASPESVEEFVAKVKRPVDQVWLDGVGQFDFYDQPEPVKLASDAAAEHFRRTL